MSRALLMILALSFTLSAVGLGALATSTPTAHAQPPICLNLPAGDHQLTTPSREREGEVTFQVTVGEGGIVTGFTEPGDQPIPPAAMLDVFAGDDAYPLPEGVAFVECRASAHGDMMQDTQAAAICVNLPAGSYEETVSAAGRSYEITISVGERGVVRDVALMGQRYGAAEAIALLEGFGTTLPAGIAIVACPDGTAGDAEQPIMFANTGSGGLADPAAQASSGIWHKLGALVVLAIALSSVAYRRRSVVRSYVANDGSGREG